MSCIHPVTDFELKDGEADPNEIVTKALDDLQKSVADKLAATEKKTADRLDRLEAAMKRPAVHTGGNSDEPKVETKAFESYLRSGRHGVASMDPVEVKALSVGTESAGGYLAPPEFTTDFVRNLVEFSPIRSIADVKTTSYQSVLVNRRTSVTNATWNGEAVASTASQPGFGQMEIKVHNLTTHVPINNQLIQDAKANVMTEVNLALAEDYGNKEGMAFVNGTGDANNQPTGFMVAAGVHEFLNGHAANLNADQLIKCLYSLPRPYRGNATWVMNGTTLATVQTLKDGHGNYLWQPSYQAGQPQTLLGRPVIEADDMPDIAAGAFPIALGDFKRAYRIYDRLALDLLIDPYVLATTQQTRVHAWRRVGGDVVQPEALRKLKMATA